MTSNYKRRQETFVSSMLVHYGSYQKAEHYLSFSLGFQNVCRASLDSVCNSLDIVACLIVDLFWDNVLHASTEVEYIR